MLEVRSPSAQPPRFPGLNLDARHTLISSELIIRFKHRYQIHRFLEACDAHVDLSFLLKEASFHRISVDGSSEIILKLPTPDTDRADTLSSHARLLSAQVYTGMRSHFIRFRDPNAPFGYDVAEDILTPEPQDTSLYLYDLRGRIEVQLIEDIDTFSLILQTQLTIEESTRSESEDVFVVFPLGIEPQIMRWCEQRKLTLTYTRVRRLSAKTVQQASVLGLLAGRLETSRIHFLRGVPGVRICRQANPHMGIDYPYQPRLSLDNLERLYLTSDFLKSRIQNPSTNQSILLFHSGPGGRTEHELFEYLYHPIPLETLMQERMVGAFQDATAIGESPSERLSSVQGLPMQPQIIPSRSILSSTQSALLIPLEHLSWLLKLLYFLPKTLMQQHRFAMDQTHIFVIAEEDVSGLPLGIPYHQASRNVFIPLGFDLKPEMSPEVWSAFFQTTDQTAVFFIADEGSVGSNKRLDGRFKRVDMSHFQPLSRSHLATPAEQLEWMDVDTVESSVLSPAPEVIEGELSVFSLWRGDRDASEIKSTSRLLSNHSSSLSSKTPSQDGEP